MEELRGAVQLLLGRGVVWCARTAVCRLRCHGGERLQSTSPAVSCCVLEECVLSNCETLRSAVLPFKRRTGETGSASGLRLGGACGTAAL